MKNFPFNKPISFFGLAILVLWIITFLSPTEAVDIQIHDTYFVLAFYHLTIVATIALLGMGIMYWCFPENKLNKWMTIFHILLTIIPILLFFIWYGLPSDSTNFLIHADSIGSIQSVLIIFLLFIFGQIIFVLNLLIAVLR